MKGVYQNKRTNCVAACVASIFEKDIADVPKFRYYNWFNDLLDWLKPIGLTAVNTIYSGDVPDEYLPKGYTMGAIPHHSPDFPEDWKHCVVCLDGYVVWCPKRGEQDSAERAEEYTIIYPIDVAVYKNEQL